MMMMMLMMMMMSPLVLLVLLLLATAFVAVPAAVFAQPVLLPEQSAFQSKMHGPNN